MFCFASSALLHLFFTSNSVVFVDGGCKNISCPMAQGTLATPLGSFHSSLKQLLAWLFRLGTKPKRVHWCLLVWWCDTQLSASRYKAFRLICLPQSGLLKACRNVSRKWR